LEQVVCAEMSATLAHFQQQLFELKQQVAHDSRKPLESALATSITAIGLPEDYRIAHVNSLAKQWLASRVHV
jgi:hypothetical protein